MIYDTFRVPELLFCFVMSIVSACIPIMIIIFLLDWRSPPPVFSTYNQDAHFVDVYLDTTRLATIDDSNYTLCAGWLGSVPYRQGMTFQQLEKEILPQHFPVSS